MAELKDIESLHGRIRTVLQYLEMPVLIVNSKYKTAYINPAFEKNFGASFRDSLGKDMGHFLTPSMVDAMVTAGEEVLEKRDSHRFTLQDGNNYHSVGTSPITDDNERITGMVFSFTDITKERQLDKVKADFISLLLNDLQAPLFDIMDTFKFIETKSKSDKSLMPEIRRGLDRAKEMIGHLERMLHITESISGEITLSKSPCDVASLVSSVVTSLQEMARRENVKLHLFGVKIPQIMCDRDKLLQVFISLISNQITAAGDGATVAVSGGAPLTPSKETKEMRESPEKVFISIAQTGKMLSEDDVPELAASLENRQPNCDPMCLAVAKIIEAHEGKLSLVGLENLGSAVTLTLPVK